MHTKKLEIVKIRSIDICKCCNSSSNIQTQSVPARTPAVIGLYETPCKSKLYQLGFTARGLPNSYALTLAVFDRLKASDIWYKWYPEIMDLFIRYNVSTTEPLSSWCPTILFQPADWSHPVIPYNPSIDPPFVEWVWSHLAINELTFKNTLDKPINLVMKAADSHSNNIVSEAVLAQLAAHETKTLNPSEVGAVLHAGDTIVAVDDSDTVINRYLLDTVASSYDIVQSNDPQIIDDAKYKQMMNEKVKLRDNRDWSTRRRYLNNIKTPQFMPSFTSKGFKYMKMPQDVCSYLKEFHRETILVNNKKRAEGFPKDGTQINVREIATFMAHIPPNKKQWIGTVLQPLMEEWSGTKLKYSTIYGMREYRKGAVLKTHCDRVETHIISAILHIYHEPIDEPWPIEVTSWDGKRYHIEDDICTMTFYESAKLIHGRPSTYNGTSWVNAFLHYRPTDWKGYTFTPDNKLITPTDEVPLVDYVYG